MIKLRPKGFWIAHNVKVEKHQRVGRFGFKERGSRLGRLAALSQMKLPIVAKFWRVSQSKFARLCWLRTHRWFRHLSFRILSGWLRTSIFFRFMFVIFRTTSTINLKRIAYSYGERRWNCPPSSPKIMMEIDRFRAIVAYTSNISANNSFYFSSGVSHK